MNNPHKRKEKNAMFYEDEYTQIESKISKIISQKDIDIKALSDLFKNKPFKERPSGSWQAIIYFPLMLNYTNTNPKGETLKKHHEAFKIITQNGGNVFATNNYSVPVYKRVIEQNDVALFKILMNAVPKKEFPHHDMHISILDFCTKKSHKTFDFISILHDAGYRLRNQNLESENSLVIPIIAYKMFLKKSRDFHKDTLSVMKFFKKEYNASIPPKTILNIYDLYAICKGDSKDEILSWCVENCKDKSEIIGFLQGDKYKGLRPLVEKIILKEGVGVKASVSTPSRKI